MPLEAQEHKNSPLLPDVSHCGCPLPEGAWGTDGWHFARYTRGRLVNKAKRDWLAKHGTPRGFEYAAEFYDSQIGLAFAFEQCPAYLAKVRQGMDFNKARKAAPGPRTYENG